MSQPIVLLILRLYFMELSILVALVKAFDGLFPALCFVKIRMSSEITLESGKIIVFVITLLFDGFLDTLPACGTNVIVSEFFIHGRIHLLAKLKALIPEGGKVAGGFIQDINHYEGNSVFVEEREELSHP